MILLIQLARRWWGHIESSWYLLLRRRESTRQTWCLCIWTLRKRLHCAIRINLLSWCLSWRWNSIVCSLGQSVNWLTITSHRWIISLRLNRNSYSWHWHIIRIVEIICVYLNCLSTCWDVLSITRIVLIMILTNSLTTATSSCHTYNNRYYNSYANSNR